MYNEENEFKDDFIKGISKNTDRKELSEDFEINLMNAIRLRSEFKNDIASKLRKSLYYFLTAIVLVLAYITITISSKLAVDNTVSLLSIITLFIVIVISILITSNYSRLLNKSIIYKE